MDKYDINNDLESTIPFIYYWEMKLQCLWVLIHGSHHFAHECTVWAGFHEDIHLCFFQHQLGWLDEQGVGSSDQSLTPVAVMLAVS